MGQQSFDVGVSFLVLLFAAGFVAGFAALFFDPRDQATLLGKVCLAAEAALLGGVCFWLPMRVLGPPRLEWLLYGRWYVYALLGSVACSAVFLWPFLAWRVGKALKTPLWRGEQPTNRLCGAMLGSFLLADVVWRVMQM